MESSPRLRGLLGILVFAAIGLFLAQAPELSCTTIRRFGESSAGLPLIVSASVAGIVVGLPRTLVVAACGMIYGALWGALIAQLSAWSGALIAFGFARFVARDWVHRRLLLVPRFGDFVASLHAGGTAFCIFLRLNPVFHFSIFSYACGLTPMRFGHYALGTFVGMLPASLVLAYAGAVLGCALIDRDAPLPPEARIGLAIAFTLLAGVSLLPMVLLRRSRR